MRTVHKLLILRSGLLAARAIFIVAMSAMMGGGIALQWLAATDISSSSALAQSLEHRLTTIEGQSSTALGAVADLKFQMKVRDDAITYQDKRISELENQVSTMRGIGIGIGAIAVIMQLLQVFFSREIRKVKE